MFGAIFGDIIGSRFEFDRGGKTKDFTLFTNEDSFTDDTVMTIAIGEALLEVGKEADEFEIKNAMIHSMKKWARRYPNAGYGARFIEWLFYKKSTKPYGSFGNGSAMRVSAVGWLYDSLERTREVARFSAEVTHNHKEGVKGAECTASVMFLSRTGWNKEDIKEYVVKEFGYDVSESLDHMRARHAHIETCQDSLPKALVSFFDGESYEDVIRNAVSLGGDTDTIAAIAGAMAEAYYGMPISILAEGMEYLPEEIKEVLTTFDQVLGRSMKDTKEDLYKNNKYIKMAVEEIYKNHCAETLAELLDVLLKRLYEKGEVLAPMVDKNHVLSDIDVLSLKRGDTFTLNQDLRLTLDKMQDSQGNLWIPLFTDEEEMNKGDTTNIRINIPIQTILESGFNEAGVKGIVINPFGQSFVLPKDILVIVLNHYHKNNKE